MIEKKRLYREQQTRELNELKKQMKTLLTYEKKRIQFVPEFSGNDALCALRSVNRPFNIGVVYFDENEVLESTRLAFNSMPQRELERLKITIRYIKHGTQKELIENIQTLVFLPKLSISYPLITGKKAEDIIASTNQTNFNNYLDDSINFMKRNFSQLPFSVIFLTLFGNTTQLLNVLTKKLRYRSIIIHILKEIIIFIFYSDANLYLKYSLWNLSKYIMKDKRVDKEKEIEFSKMGINENFSSFLLKTISEFIVSLKDYQKAKISGIFLTNFVYLSKLFIFFLLYFFIKFLFKKYYCFLFLFFRLYFIFL